MSWWLLGSGLVCGVLVAAVLCAFDAYLRNLRP
jgi:hypothetical protein